MQANMFMLSCITKYDESIYLISFKNASSLPTNQTLHYFEFCQRKFHYTLASLRGEGLLLLLLPNSKFHLTERSALLAREPPTPTFPPLAFFPPKKGMGRRKRERKKVAFHPPISLPPASLEQAKAFSSSSSSLLTFANKYLRDCRPFHYSQRPRGLFWRTRRRRTWRRRRRAKQTSAINTHTTKPSTLCR